MISPVRPSTTSPVRPAKSTNSFSPATWVWRIVGFSRPAQPRYRSQNQEYPNPSGAPARYSSHSSASVTLGRRSSRCTQAQLARIGDALDHRRAPEVDAVKEAQGADRLVESVP